MRFVVLGAGAIGAGVGGSLARAGAEVVLIARGAQRAALRAGGLRIETPDGAEHVAVAVADDPAAVTWHDGDVVVLAVKTQDADAALIELAAAAPPSTPVACFTNGIEAERLALRRFDHVHGAYVFVPATLAAPGVVRLWFTPARGAVAVGRYPDGTGPLDHELTRWLDRAGFTATARADVMRWKRGKLIRNLGNALQALCGAADTRALRRRAEDEARACFAAAGLTALDGDEEAGFHAGLRVGEIDGARRTGSTWQSLARATGSAEGDYLNGEIVLLGRLHGVATPVNRLLQRRLAEAARTRQAPGTVPVDELVAALPT